MKIPAPRFQLTPGLQVVARGRDHLQVGLEAHRVVLPRTPQVQQLVTRLVKGDPVDDPDTDPNLATLLDAGAACSGPIPDDRLARALALADPHDWERRLEARASAGVRVTGGLGLDPAPLLAQAGLGTGDKVVLFLSPGELDRTRLDPLIRARTPHLLVRHVDGVVTIGPFVWPGTTACLECIELHEAEQDPHLPEVRRRYHEATGAGPSAGPDPVLLSLAMAWAVRDLANWAEGQAPSTWSSTWRFTSDGPPTQTDWWRHPACGCAWQAGAA